MEIKGAIIGVVLIICLFSSSPALADLNFGHRLNNSDCDNPSDPVHIMFYSNGTLANTLSEFSSHVGWSDYGDATMYFTDHGYCTPQDADRETAGLFSSPRDHIRFEYVEQYYFWGYYTLASVHHDDCLPHKAVDFNTIRDYIASCFSNGGHLVWKSLYDTPYVITISNCNGITDVFVDGYWQYIEL